MEFRQIALELIQRDPNQPRQAIDPRGLEGLAQSIRDRGILQPIRVRVVASRYQVIAGERRWLAATSAGLTEIPALVVEADDDQAFIESLIENIQREDLNAIDRARALRRLRVTLGLQSWNEVGRAIGISRIHVHRLLNVARLPEAIQEDIRAGDLTEKHARALLQLRQHPGRQRELWGRIRAESLTGDAAVDLAKAMLPHRDLRPEPASANIGRLDLKSITDQFLTALVAAAPADIESARVELNDLRGWLSEVLDERNRRSPASATFAQH